MAILESESGTKFDPEILARFTNMIENSPARSG
jgi:HD-GYP domain-containing protein (c-di-GMP phosphodiesterase class II)